MQGPPRLGDQEVQGAGLATMLTLSKVLRRSLLVPGLGFISLCLDVLKPWQMELAGACSQGHTESGVGCSLDCP